MENNHLKIGKFDAVDLAKKFSTPLYVYNGETIETNFKKINLAIPYEMKQVHYAIMCNDRSEILKILLNLGSYIQANSLKEYKLVRKVGFPNDKISIATTNMSIADMKEFAGFGAMINFDSIEEIERYGKIIAELESKNKKLNRKIGIRVFISQEANGQSITNAPYLPKSRVGIKQNRFNELKDLAQKYNLKIVGIHGYLASNMLNLEPFLKLNNFLFECAKQFSDIEYINFGAGFGIALKPSEKDFDWATYGKILVLLMDEAEKFFGRKINLKIEPGRALVGEAGILLTEVNNVKDMESWREVGVNCGFGVFARPYIYKWNEGGYHPIVLANKFKQEAQEIYTICGNSVLQGDYLAEDRKLPNVEIGDYLAILQTGAYGATMMSSFPGMRRAGEILIHRDKIKVINRIESY
jgi:diaminopimelate decarboxylase